MSVADESNIILKQSNNCYKARGLFKNVVGQSVYQSK